MTQANAKPQSSEGFAENSTTDPTDIHHGTVDKGDPRASDITDNEAERRRDTDDAKFDTRSVSRQFAYQYGMARSESELKSEAHKLMTRISLVPVDEDLTNDALTLIAAGNTLCDNALLTTTDKSKTLEFAKDAVTYGLRSNLLRNVITNVRWNERYTFFAMNSKDATKAASFVSDAAITLQMAKESAAALNALAFASDQGVSDKEVLDAVRRVEQQEMARNQVPATQAPLDPTLSAALAQANATF